MLLYDGNGLDARIVGLSYLGLTDPENPPEGFAGPNDPWHQHIGLCLKGTRVIGDVDTTEEECVERGGRKSALDDLWMAHAWVSPAGRAPGARSARSTPTSASASPFRHADALSLEPVLPAEDEEEDG